MMRYPASLLILVCGLSAALAARVATSDPIQGNPKAAVRVIIYQDLECPDCAEWHKVLESQIIPKFGSRVEFEFRDFPLPQHLWSFNAAVLARYFDTRGSAIGLAWRDYCFVHQSEFTPDSLLDRAVAWAQPFGITRAQLTTVFSRTDLFNDVEADRTLGERAHLDHTPTVLFNGVEATTPEQLEQMLTQALANGRR